MTTYTSTSWQTAFGLYLNWVGKRGESRERRKERESCH